MQATDTTQGRLRHVDYVDEVLDRLIEGPCCGYAAGGPPATEPTALAAMALWAHGRCTAAARALDWLLGVQSDEGSLGVDAEKPHPRWATGWAVLAWHTALADPVALSHSKAAPAAALRRWAAATTKAIDWMKTLFGHGCPQVAIYGHKTALRAWPWVETTHSWIEPSAINVLALKAVGQGAGPRVREAVELLLDRMLPDGGWNYGNTTVLGNTLRSHLQPTGLALAALYGESSAARHVERSIAYLERTVSGRTATASLCYSLLGAAAHGRCLPQADRWLRAAARRTLDNDGSPYKLALVGLAALGADGPWFTTVAAKPAHSTATIV